MFFNFLFNFKQVIAQKGKNFAICYEVLHEEAKDIKNRLHL